MAERAICNQGNQHFMAGELILGSSDSAHQKMVEESFTRKGATVRPISDTALRAELPLDASQACSLEVLGLWAKQAKDAGANKYAHPNWVVLDTQ